MREYPDGARVEYDHSVVAMLINGIKTLTVDANDCAKKADDQTEMPVFEIVRKDGDNHSYTQASRDSYTGVKAFWMDTAKAKKQSVVVGVLGNAKHLRETYATESDALDAAKAEWQCIRRGQASMVFDLAIGKARVNAAMHDSVQRHERAYQ